MQDGKEVQGTATAFTNFCCSQSREEEGGGRRAERHSEESRGIFWWSIHPSARKANAGTRGDSESQISNNV